MGTIPKDYYWALTPDMSRNHTTSTSGETRVPFMITMETLMLGLAIAATTLRTYLRRRSMGRLRVEDWCCVGATVRALPLRLGPIRNGVF